MRVLWAMLLLCFFGRAAAQDFKNDLERAAEVFTKAKQLEVVVKTKTFEKEENEWVPAQEEEIRFYKKGDLMFYRLSNMEILFSGDLIITVFHEAGTIVYRKRDREAEKQMGFFSFSDSLALAEGRVSFQGIKEGVKLYYQNLEREKTEIEISTATGYFKRLVSFYEPTEDHGAIKSEIIFETFNPKAKVKKENFDAQKYIIQKGSSYELSPAYNTYDLIHPDAN